MRADGYRYAARRASQATRHSRLALNHWRAGRPGDKLEAELLFLGVLGGLLGVIAPVEAEQLALAVDLAEKVDRSLPHPVQVGQRVARVVELEIDALVMMAQQQLGAILEVALFDVNEGLAEVGELEQQPLF